MAPVLGPGDPEARREAIRLWFLDSWEHYERLFTLLADEDAFLRRADPLRHPLIFYFGHTAVFYINKLMAAGLIERRIDPVLESMLAVGVDEMSWDDLDQSYYEWPSSERVRRYRAEVRALVLNLLDRLTVELPIRWDNPLWVILMAIEHERIHLETSAVLIRQLPLTSLRRDPRFPVCPLHGEPPPLRWAEVPGGTVRLGKDHDHPLYGWDNEYGEQAVEVAPFEASRTLISHRDYLAFIEEGGYRERRYWSEEGWAWRSYEAAERPRFWQMRGGEHFLRCLAEEIPMPWNWPVEVNQLEAQAYCQWLGERLGRPVRLPSEAEWRRMLEHSGWCKGAASTDLPGHLHLRGPASSVPVDQHERGGFFDLVGNVWQHSNTPIQPFEGFRTHPLYDDFSVPTFDERHNLILGGSWLSTGNEATEHSRYAFRRHFYQCAGIRPILAAPSEETSTGSKNVYESDELVAQYAEFHYGQPSLGSESFPVKMARLCLEIARAQGWDLDRRRALDLGCATGRATFELARGFGDVTGIDFSTRFIRIGEALRAEGYLDYIVPTEGDLVERREVRLDRLNLDAARTRVRFLQGDALNLRPRFSGYDLILAANLLDRLADPAAFLARVHERLAPGGLLVLSSPWTWLEAFTPREKWLGGRLLAGRPRSSMEAVREILSPRFVELHKPLDQPFVIRETARKHQHTIAQVSFWRQLP